MGDIIDIFGLVTGIGVIFSLISDLIISPIIFIGVWRTSSNIKHNQDIIKKLFSKLEEEQRKLKIINQKLKTSKSQIKTMNLNKLIGNRPSASKIISSLDGKDILIKNAGAIFADFIPAIDFVPWRTILIYLTYIKEREAFEKTLQTAQEIYNIEIKINKSILELQAIA